MIIFKWYRIVVEIKYIYLNKALSKGTPYNKNGAKDSPLISYQIIGLDTFKGENAYNFQKHQMKLEKIIGSAILKQTVLYDDVVQFFENYIRRLMLGM